MPTDIEPHELPSQAAVTALLEQVHGVPYEAIAKPANDAALKMSSGDVADAVVIVNVEPGDMTRYQFILTDLESAHGGDPMIVRDLGLPGDLQVSLINLCGGRSFCIASDGYASPGLVADALSSYRDPANPHTVIVVTAFLQTFIDFLSDYRAIR